MDEFTRELGIGFLHLLWYSSICPDVEDKSASARRILIAEVVDRLRGETLGRDEDLRQLVAEFGDRMEGRPHGKRAAQFAEAFASFIIGEEPVEALLAQAEHLRQSMPQYEPSQQGLARHKYQVQEARDKCLAHLEDIKQRGSNKISDTGTSAPDPQD